MLNEEEEAHILIHSLRDANVPKFLAEDVPLFESILADLFPGIEPPQQHLESLEVNIDNPLILFICENVRCEYLFYATFI